MPAWLLIVLIALGILAGVAAGLLSSWVERPYWLTDLWLRIGFVCTLAVLVLTGVVTAWYGDGDHVASSLVGGCDAFPLYAQNEFPPYGTALRASPNPNSRKVGGFAPNEIISVDGWVVSQPAYPTNPEPWNSGVWFHVADNLGWVSFPGVRAYPTGHVADRLGGYAPAPADPKCAGSIRS
jgi:hypothetical protein